MSKNISKRIVLLTDSLSTIEALTSRNRDLEELRDSPHKLSKHHEVTLRWIPGHCGIPRTKRADTLAKEGSTKCLSHFATEKQRPY
jgi:ribonuclease HI